MRPLSLLSVSLGCIGALQACSTELSVSDDVDIECQSDADCLPGFECQTVLNRCFRPGVNQVPTITLGSIVRTTGSVSIPVTVTDFESDSVQLQLEIDSGAGFVSVPSAAATVTASPNGVVETLSWNADIDLGDTAYRSSVRARVTPSDATAVGAAVISEDFDYGNDAPIVETVAIDDPVVTGLTVIRVEISDSASDDVDVARVELSLTGDFSDAIDIPLNSGVGQSFPAGAITGFTTTPAGTTLVSHAIVWDSSPDASVDQTGARIRLTVSDGFVNSAAVQSAEFDLDNANSAPVIALLSAMPTTVSGDLTIDYRLEDLDGDACLLGVAYTVGAGASSPAASSSDIVGLVPGDHSFVWQTSQLGFDIYADVVLELVINDSRIAGNTLVIGPFTVDNRAIGGNRPPSLAIGVVPRATGPVAIPVTVFDTEGDMVDFDVEIDWGSGFSTVAATGAPIAGTPGGTSATLTWDAPTSLGSSAFVGGVLARITPRDAAGGTPVTSEPFDFGNDVPVIESLVLDDAIVSGLTVVRFDVSDSSSDVVDVASLEFSLLGDFSDAVTLPLVGGVGTAFPAGSLAGFVTSPGGEPSTLIWDSAATPEAQLDLAAGARLRLLVSDTFGSSMSLESSAFGLDNTTGAPVLSLTDPGAIESDIVSIDYTITDSDGDSCLVGVEYSLNGMNWFAAASGSTTVGLVPGDYTFDWQSTQLGFGVYDPVELRFRVSDANDVGTPVTTVPFQVDNTAAGGNAPPTAWYGALEPATGGRFLTTVTVPFGLSDPNGSMQTVDVTVEYSLDQSTWYTATPTSSSPGLTNLAAAPTPGTLHTFEWDALADATAGGKGLSVELVRTNPSGARDVPVVASQPDVYLRITGTDSGSPPQSTPQVISPAIDIGNGLPSAALSPITEAASGNLPVEFTISDSAPSDNASLELEFRENGGGPWRTAFIALGTTTDLATSVGGKTYVAVWGTATALDPTLTIPQGIGPQHLTTVDLRVRPLDQPAGVSVTHYGDWVQTGPVEIVNQTPPRVERIYVKNDGNLHNGAIPIVYSLIDEQSDPSDVLIEYSRDNGDTWFRCTSYFTPYSEGTFQLASGPGNVGGGGGVLHSFVWDSTSDLFVQSPSTRLRITAADAFAGAGQPLDILQFRPVGPTDEPPQTAMFEPSIDVSVGSTASYIAVEDFNGDGIYDLAAGEEINAEVTVFLGLGSGGVWNGGFAEAAGSPYSVPLDVSAIAAGDFTCDGTLDLAVGVNMGFNSPGAPELIVLRGNGNGTFTQTAASPYALPAQARDLVAGEFSGDGRGDLAVAISSASDSVAIFAADSGLPPCDFIAAETYALTFGSYGLVLGEFSGDSTVDLVAAGGGTVTVLEGQGSLAPMFVVGSAHSTPGPFYLSLAAADFNNDGILDLAGPDQSDGVYVVVGQGVGGVPDGTFVDAASNPFPMGDATRHLAVHDFNFDGIDDFVAANFSSGDAVVGLARGVDGVWAESFEASLSLSAGLQVNRVVVRDLNLDGIGDIIAADRSGDVGIFVAKGAPTLSESAFTTAAGYDGGPSLQSTAFGDFNLDGIRDVVGAGAGFSIVLGGGVSNTPNGTLSLDATFPSGSLTTTPVVADFDRDGILDVAVAVRSSGVVSVWLGEGADGTNLGSFVEASGSPYSVPNIIRLTLALDVTGDTDPDVMALAHTGSTLTATLLVGQGDGSFTSQIAGTGTMYPWGAVPGDFDGDGNVDVAIAEGSGGNVYLFLGDGAGAFTITAPVANVANSSYGLVSGDFNQDGIPDLAVGGTVTFTEAYTHVFLGQGANGQGNGAFVETSSSPYAVNARNFYLAAGDFTGDGILDLASAADTDDNVSIHEGQGVGGIGTGDFSAGFTLTPAGIRPWSLLAADFNGDAMLDLSTADIESELVSIWTIHRENGRYGWIRGLIGPGASPFKDNVIGATTVASETDLFGNPVGAGFSQRRFHGENDSRPGDLSDGIPPQMADFRALLRISGLSHPVGLIPLSHPWVISGAVSLVRVTDPALGGAQSTGTRYQVRRRFGALVATDPPQRDGLDLGAGSPRGIIVDLPVLPGRSASGTIRVFARTVDFVRADEAIDPVSMMPWDPMALAVGADDYLPRMETFPASGAYQDVIRRTYAWEEIGRAPGDDLSLGSGRRFALDGDRIRVLTDRVGVFQAFDEP